MIKERLYLFTVVVIGLMAILTGCDSENKENKESIRVLETNIKNLEDNAKIKTFPLTLIVSDYLAGNALPPQMQDLCRLSKLTCKTLPIAGILRLGSNNYYENNSLSSLALPDNLKSNEADLTDTVERQVSTFLSSVKLHDYDSLLTPNHPDWDMSALSLDYLRNSADSVFFFSATQAGPGAIVLGNKTYLIFNDIAALRKKIDEIICTGQKTISVFYNSAPFDSTQVTVTRIKWPAKATPAGDTCIADSKYEKLHDGMGGFMAGDLLELHSKGCGFKYPTGLAGDTCIQTSRYQKMHNGKGGFTVGNIIEQNSRACGFSFPKGIAGDTCISGSRFQKLHNGQGGFTTGNLIEKNSRSCGFVFPTGVAGDTCINGSKYQKMHNGRGGFNTGRLLEKNSRDCGFRYADAGTAASGYICDKGSKYAKLNDGKGGFTKGALLETNSRDCGVTPPPPIAQTVSAPVVKQDNVCATKSDAICEKDASGNYTGRRVQYCYNKSGRTIRTIVIARCDGDCRCLGN